MSTTYWQTSFRSLGSGVSYLDQNQFPQMLLLEEGEVPLPYSDSQDIATIGIGVNLTVTNYMALALQQLGAINATQTVSQQLALVTQFA